MKNYFLLFVALLSFITSALGQNQDPPIQYFDYSKQKTYYIGGMTVTGIRFLDPDILLSLSGLRVGDKISIPGEDVSRAIHNLWDQGLFTDIEVYVTKIIGSDIFLEFKLQERPRLSKFSFKGLKKSEADEIREKIKLIKGRVVTENVKLNAVNQIRNYFDEKGFLNAKVSVREEVDSVLLNSVTLIFDVNKGAKVKIERILFEGNTQIADRKLKSAMKGTKEKFRFSPREVLQFREEGDSAKPNVINILNNLAFSEVYNHLMDRSNLNLFSSSKYKEVEFEADKQKVISVYNNNGFKDARIVFDTVYQANSGHLRVVMRVEEGMKYYFRNITWKGNTKYSDQKLDEILQIRKGEVYDQSLLETRLYMNPAGTDVSSLYMDDGYLFFSVTPVEIAVVEDSVDIEIRIYEGPQATINEVRIVGNTKTSEHVIRRELRTLPGSKFSRADLIRSQREIANLGYFDPEQINVVPYPNPEKGTVDIEYTVAEKPSDQLELSAGWGGRGRGVVGSLGVSFTNFSLRNILVKEAWSPLPAGDGQRFSIRIQSNGKIFQSYTVSFTEPWLGGKKPNSFTVSYYNSRFADLNRERKVEGTLATNGASVGIGTRLKWPDDYFTLSHFLNFQNFALNNWVSSNFIITDGRSNNFSFKETFARNSIDQPLYPRSGSRFSLSLQITPPFSLFSNLNYRDPELSPNDRYKWVEYHKWRFDMEWFTPISKDRKLVLRTAAKLGFLGVFNQDVGLSPFERFELGGDGLSNFNFFGRDIIALRGYDVMTPNDGSPIFNKYTMELRYPFSLNPSSTIYALAFAEGGNFWQSFQNYNPFDVRRAVGLGVRVFLPMFGLLGFDYGIGFDKDLGKANGFGDFLGKYGKFNIILGFEPE